jgi:thiosulfate/3-mercaptopyruvate sulfurtransferase
MYTPEDYLIEPSALPEALAKGATLLDARKAGDYKSGHIPGAMPLSTYDSLVTNSSVEGMQKFAEAMAHRFSSGGVTSERQVVVYDEATGQRAARELWLLEHLGHRNARMLHGGFAQWKALGGKVVEGADVATVRPKKLQVSVASGGSIPADELARRAGSFNFGVIDVRDDLEWAGKDDTPCCARRGHIPNAVHIEWTQFLENGRYKSPEAVIALLVKHGINPRNEVAVYCHRGARSANTYFALRASGVMGARNFIGSWHEWSARTDLPIAK